MTKAEREFIEALKDGSIQRALEDVQNKLAEMIKAWGLVLESAIKICKEKKQTRARIDRGIAKNPGSFSNKR
jgi:hypothetical protein